MRRLKVLPCPVPEQFAQARATATGRWCSHCSRHVGHSRDLDPEQFDALIQRAANSRVCMQLELAARRPKLRSAVAASVLVVGLAGCASMDAIAPPLLPQAFLDSEPLASGSSQITGFVIDEDGSALAGAVVMLEGGSLSAPVEAISNEMGMYGFSEVPPGDYVLIMVSGQGRADASVSVPQHTRVRVSFRGPYAPDLSTMIVGYLEIIEEPGSFAEPGPFLVERGG